MSTINKLFIYFTLVFSIFIGLYFGENSSGGAKIDFEYLFPFIQELSFNFKEGFISFVSDSGSLIHSPVFSILNSQIYNFLGSTINLKIAYILISCCLPFLFYRILVEKYEIKNDFIFLFSLVIFFSPYFRSSAIWLLGDNLTILFFGLSILYFNRVLKKENRNLKNYFLTLFFLILCCYIRYYFCFFYFFYMSIFYKKLSFSKFFLLNCFSGILSIPAIIYFYFIFNNFGFFERVSNYSHFNYYRNCLIICSIIFFYLIPFITVDIKKLINHFKNKKNYLIILSVIIFLFWIIDYFVFKSFDDHSKFGGGFFFKFAQVLNLNLGFCLSILTIFLFITLDYFFNDKKFLNFFLLFILILSFPVQVIFQKYFDPLFYFFMFGLVNFKKEILLSNNMTQLIGIMSYYIVFFIFSLIYYQL